MTQHTTTKHRNNSGPAGAKTFILAFVVLLPLIILSPHIHAQEGAVKDTTATVKKPHSPTRAAIYSAILPGLGQGYNRKYWKIPIVYAGFGVITYFIINNTSQYRDYKEAYTYVASGDSSYTDNELVGKYDEQQLLDGKNYYRRNMELSYIIGALWYILNIIDASVDAHFFDYDVSEDLSIRVDPMMHVRPEDLRPVTGVRLTLKF
jgi:hypothetical protein